MRKIGTLREAITVIRRPEEAARQYVSEDQERGGQPWGQMTIVRRTFEGVLLKSPRFRKRAGTAGIVYMNGMDSEDF